MSNSNVNENFYVDLFCKETQATEEIGIVQIDGAQTKYFVDSSSFVHPRL